MAKKKRKKQQKLDIVRVKWVDSGSQHGWVDLDDVVEPVLDCVTVGIRVRENKDTVTVAASLAFGGDGNQVTQVDSPITIPKRCINSIKPWGRGK